VPERLRSFLVCGVRVVCHVAVAAPFAAVCIYEMARGWAPQGDDGVIVFRSWAVLTAHALLLGQRTEVLAPHTIYDLGPMLYWLLTVPVHLDPLQGGLWGAALWCIVALWLAVEAAWSVIGWRGGIGVAAVVLVTVAELPSLVIDPVWNPHIGMVWFLATVAIAWAVATGRLGWWPVLVLAASMSAQIHLMFALGSIACAIVAPVIGLIRTRRLGRWLPIGLAVGLGCWIAPLVQEVSARHGNMTLILHLGRHSGPAVGATFGLRSLAAVVGPDPIWWSRDRNKLGIFALVGHVAAHPAWLGVVVLAGLAAIAAIAWVTHRRVLSALAVVTLLWALATVWTVASLPTSQFFSFTYMEPAAWPLGTVVLLVAAWSVGEVVTAVIGDGARYRAHRRPGHAHKPRRMLPRVEPFLGAGAVVAIGVAGALVASAMVHDSATDNIETSGWPAMRQVRVATAEIQRAVPRGRVLVVGPRQFSASYSVIPGVDWLLFSSGWRPESYPGYTTLIGPEVAPEHPLPAVTATVTYNGGPVTVALSGRVPDPRRSSASLRGAPGR